MTDPASDQKREDLNVLSEAESKRRLRDSGFEVPEFRVVVEEEEAVEAAREVGYPVVIKVSSSDIVHKSEWGGGSGVSLHLTGDDEVRAAFQEVMSGSAEGKEKPEVLVESEVETSGGWEVIVGGKRERSFGPVLMVGSGGVFAEMVEDVVFLLIPFTEREADRLLNDLMCAEMFEDPRGREPVDRGALLEFLFRAGKVLEENEEIREMDMNPVLVREDRQIVLDASMILRGQVREHGGN